MRLLVDTNVLVDYFVQREPFSQKAQLLMIAGKVGEFELWMSSSQTTDLLYILGKGASKQQLPLVTAALDGLLDFVNVFAPSKQELRAALRAHWNDPEDALLHVVAQKLEAHAIITRNAKDFKESLVPVLSAEEFFEQLAQDGRVYDFVGL